MASQVPPIRGAAFTYQISLVSRADVNIFQANATLAAGDVVVYQDGVLDGNADNIPTVIGASKVITHTLSIAEMTADQIVVVYSDQVGDEWQDAAVTIHTASVLIDDLPTAVENRVEMDANSTQLADIVVDIAAVDAAVAAVDAAVAAVDAIVTTIAANVVIILARIGAFTGTGVNTILGFLRAMSRNDLAAPSDMGGTFAPLRHSLQALFSLFIRAECSGTVSADELTVVRGDSYDSDDDNAIEALGDISTYTKIWITAKHSKDQDDAEAIFMVLLSNPAVPLTDGLQYLNGAESDALAAGSAISRTWGAITISDDVAGDIAFTLDEDATDDLVPSELDYDIQWTDGTDVETVRDDRVTITADVTRAIT